MLVYFHVVMESQNNESTYIRKSYASSPMMFRMSCDESALEEDVEPLPPDICMEQVWQEQGNIIRHSLTIFRVLLALYIQNFKIVVCFKCIFLLVLILFYIKAIL